jgi:hypothetical protein
MKFRLAPALALLLLLAHVSRADDAAPAAGAPAAPAQSAKKGNAPTDDDLRIRGVFESALPGTEKKSSLRLIVHPHLGDVTKREHIRTALGFRYGLTARWEATAETVAYFSHGLKNEAFFEKEGFAEIHLGTKYRLGDPLHIGWDTSVGLDWTKPIGSPPPDVTDGLEHVSPFVSLSRPLVSRPDIRVFWGFGYDDVTRTGIVGQLDKNDLGFDSIGANVGLVWTRGDLAYTFETTYGTTSLTSDVDRYVVSFRPGIVWTLPKKYTFNAKGRWLLGVALRASHGSGGTDFGLGAKLRVNFDFKRLLGLKKDAPSSQ